MGSNRVEHKNNETAKIQRSIAEEFGVTNSQLYQVWIGYMSRFKNRQDGPTSISMMRANPDRYPAKALDCFIGIGLTMFAEDFVQEIVNVK